MRLKCSGISLIGGQVDIFIKEKGIHTDVGGFRQFYLSPGQLKASVLHSLDPKVRVVTILYK